MGAKNSQVFFAAAALLCGQALACDWKVISDEVDPMNDERVCIISSQQAQIALAVRGREVTFLTRSAYTRDSLQVRIDENEAIWLGETKRTTEHRDNARRALAEIRAGSRIRTSYRDYPESRSGDAPICTLPALIDSCAAPAR